MSVKQVTMYTIICDGCGKDACDGDEQTVFWDVSDAEVVADESGWHIPVYKDQADKHYCPSCYEIGDDDVITVKRKGK